MLVAPVVSCEPYKTWVGVELLSKWNWLDCIVSQMHRDIHIQSIVYLLPWINDIIKKKKKSRSEIVHGLRNRPWNGDIFLFFSVVRHLPTWMRRDGVRDLCEYLPEHKKMPDMSYPCDGLRLGQEKKKILYSPFVSVTLVLLFKIILV